MPIDIATLARLVLFVTAGGLVLLSFTFLAEFFLPILVGAGLLVIAYLIFKYLTTGTLGF